MADQDQRNPHFGFLSNRHRAKSWRCAANCSGWRRPNRAPDPAADYRDRFEALTGQSLRECPHCHTGIMVVVDCIARPKSARRFRIHHDPAPAHKPHEPDAPARSECGGLSSTLEEGPEVADIEEIGREAIGYFMAVGQSPIPPRLFGNTLAASLNGTGAGAAVDLLPVRPYWLRVSRTARIRL
jgi:hypothetical protein